MEVMGGGGTMFSAAAMAARDGGSLLWLQMGRALPWDIRERHEGANQGLQRVLVQTVHVGDVVVLDRE